MICPNCGKEMTIKDLTIYHCVDCNIEYNEHTHVWIVPEHLQPSIKQQKSANAIHNILGVALPQPIKKAYWQYINKYKEESQSRSDLELDYYIEGAFNEYY